MAIRRPIFRLRNPVCYVVEQSTDLIGHVQCWCDMLTERTRRAIESLLLTALNVAGLSGLVTVHYSIDDVIFDVFLHHVCT